MMILKLLAFSAFSISQVYSQICPMVIPCQQRGVPVAASQPIFIRASPAAVPASPCPGSPLPCPALTIANIAPNPTVLPIEYAFADLAPLPHPLSLAPAPASCYLPLQNPIPCATEFVVPSPNCLTDIFTPDPVFDIFGRLDPILTCCGPIAELEIPELLSCPLTSPYLPAASPASVLPPILTSECSCHFLKKIAIPPPFI